MYTIYSVRVHVHASDVERVCVCVSSTVLSSYVCTVRVCVLDGKSSPQIFHLTDY